MSLGSDRSLESGSGTFLEASEVGVLFGEPLFQDPGVSKTSGEANEAPLKGFGTRSAPFYRPQATFKHSKIAPKTEEAQHGPDML